MALSAQAVGAHRDVIDVDRPDEVEKAPFLQTMNSGAPQELAHLEDTPAYRTLVEANLLTTKYRKQSFEDIFVGKDLKANSTKWNNDVARCKWGYYCCPIIGCMLYNAGHSEFFVDAGHVGLAMNEKQDYLFAQPGMHNVYSWFFKMQGSSALPANGCLSHGNRVILVVEQGFIGLAFDNGQPVLFPPGIHVWTSETLQYKEAIALDQNVVKLGPYTLLTVDEGYAAITQNNGKQEILMGGETWLLNHKNWRFEKFLTLKIQTDDLEKIKATSADNITMLVTSTVTWRIADPMCAATVAAETMAVAGGKISSDIKKLRGDVLKQATASLASFMGGVNYSDSFHMAAAAQFSKKKASADGADSEPEPEEKKDNNPLYDVDRMSSSVEHANRTAQTYGVKILSINILSAMPVDGELTKALACGAVASAQALQAETAARGKAKAVRIDAEAAAQNAQIRADGAARADVVRAKAQGEAARLVADGSKKAADLLAASKLAVDLAKMDKSAAMIGKNDKFFFGQEPAYMSNLILKGEHGKGGMFG